MDFLAIALPGGAQRPNYKRFIGARKRKGCTEL
jgi:hypothetical protein